MEGLVAMYVIVGFLAMLDAFALRFGVDSRQSYRDDWVRSAEHHAPLGDWS